MENANPLSKYFRQPKVYLSLPSKGQFYPAGTLTGDATNLPVFGMNAMDEIMMKTPDALFSGESVVSVIKSCIPDIKDPWAMPQLDIDSVLIAIRIATYGSDLDLQFKCTKCNHMNDTKFDLSRALDYFASLNYENKLFVNPLYITLKPYTYKEYTNIQLQSYELRRLLAKSTSDISEVERKKLLDDFYKKLAMIESEGFKKQIQTVEADDTVVENAAQINEWIQNSEKTFFDKIKEHLEKSRKEWKIQPQKTSCSECETSNTVDIDLDLANFFVKR